MKRPRPLARYTFVALLLITSFPGLLFTLHAQEPATPVPVFRSQTNVVLVPVLVRNHGKHVTGLEQASFTLLQDGKPQKISVFEEVRTSTQRLQRAPVGPNEFTNRLIGSAQAARYTIIAIDRVNTASMDLIRVREGLIKFLTHVAETGEPICIIAIEDNGIRVLQDFTTEPEVLRAALQIGTTKSAKPAQSSIGLEEFAQEVAVAQNNGGKGLGNLLATLDNGKKYEIQQAAFQERSARISSHQALQQIAQSLAGLSGRKSLVWASSGFPFSSIFKANYIGVTQDYTAVSEAMGLDERTTRMLGEANIAMYPVDARGLTNQAWDSIDPAHKYSPTKAEQIGRLQTNRDVLTTFDHLAEGTGGQPCYNRPDLENCFKEALDDSRDYYMVGFYVDGKHTKQGWHKLQIKVAEKGTSVRARNGFLFAPKDPEKTREQDMNTAVTSLLLDAGIPFKGFWTSKEKRGDKFAEGFVIQVAPEANVVDPAEHKIDLEFVGVARAKDGTIAAKFARKVQRSLSPEAVATIQRSGVDYTYAIDLPPGEFLVRMVVRDNLTGRTGAVNTLLKVE